MIFSHSEGGVLCRESRDYKSIAILSCSSQLIMKKQTSFQTTKLSASRGKNKQNIYLGCNNLLIKNCFYNNQWSSITHVEGKIRASFIRYFDTLKFQCHFQYNCDCDCPKKIIDSGKNNEAIDTPHWNKSSAWKYFGPKYFGQSQERLTDNGHAICKKYSRSIKEKPGISLSSPLTCCSCVGNTRFSVLKAKHTSNNEWQNNNNVWVRCLSLLYQGKRSKKK